MEEEKDDKFLISKELYGRKFKNGELSNYIVNESIFQS